MRAALSPLFPDLGTCVGPRTSADLDDLAAEEVQELLRANAVVLFRGFELSIDRFRSFTNRCGFDFMPYSAGAFERRIVDDDTTLMSVSTPSFTGVIPLHGELYYRRRRPSTLCFYCVRPADTGGETSLCDGVRLLEALSPRTRRLLAENAISYVRTYPDGTWQGVFHTDDRDQVGRLCSESGVLCEFPGDGRTVRTEFTTSAIVRVEPDGPPAFVNNILTLVAQERAQVAMGFTPRSTVRFSDGSVIPSDVLDEIAYRAEALKRKLAWREGDVALVDNRRCLHGREPFTGMREIYLRLAEEESVDMRRTQ